MRRIQDFYRARTAKIPDLFKSEVDMLSEKGYLSDLGIAFDTLKLNFDEKNSLKSGRDAVSAAIKIMQRFCLQLDRSDGRPDLPIAVLANKFYDFTSVCLRTEGAAWTAAVSPFEYIGFRLIDFLGEEMSDQKSINAEVMGKAVASVLLDSQTIPAPSDNDDFLNLQLVLMRLTLRYTIFQKVLAGEPDTIFCDILINHCAPSFGGNSLYALPRELVESILLVDMNVPYVAASETSLLVRKEDISLWAHNHQAFWD